MSTEREQRNEVFKGMSGVEMRGGPHQSQKGDIENTIPVETVPLPSNGLVYPVDSVLHGCETVDIKAMTAREEDILTSKAFLKKGTVITELIKSCLINKNIDPRDLLAGDRNALMVAIRITGYGAEYDAEVECRECGAKAPHQFDLSTLPIKRLEIDPVNVGSNCFAFKLPLSKKVVHFRFLTGRDEEEVVATTEKQKKLGLQSDAAVTTSLLYSITSIDGVEDRSKIAAYTKVMPARDSLALRNYIRVNEPGITMKQETTCPSCKHVETVEMPMGVKFLWPGV